MSRSRAPLLLTPALASARALARLWVVGLLVAICVCTGTQPSEPTTMPSSEPPKVSPALVPGDLFEVRVFDEEQLSGSFQVQDDGSIQFPLLGRLDVAGRTQAELTEVIRAGLAQGFLRDPHVTVVVKERQNFEVSVLGQVNAPGSFPWVDRLTLVQAISTAGGLTPMAASKRIRLTRQIDGGRTSFEVSLQAITQGQTEDLFLHPGDIVFVPETRI